MNNSVCLFISHLSATGSIKAEGQKQGQGLVSTGPGHI